LFLSLSPPPLSRRWAPPLRLGMAGPPRDEFERSLAGSSPGGARKCPHRSIFFCGRVLLSGGFSPSFFFSRLHELTSFSSEGFHSPFLSSSLFGHSCRSEDHIGAGIFFLFLQKFTFSSPRSHTGYGVSPLLPNKSWTRPWFLLARRTRRCPFSAFHLPLFKRSLFFFFDLVEAFGG